MEGDETDNKNRDDSDERPNGNDEKKNMLHMVASFGLSEIIVHLCFYWLKGNAARNCVLWNGYCFAGQQEVGQEVAASIL